MVPQNESLLLWKPWCGHLAVGSALVAAPLTGLELKDFGQMLPETLSVLGRSSVGVMIRKQPSAQSFLRPLPAHKTRFLSPALWRIPMHTCLLLSHTKSQTTRDLCKWQGKYEQDQITHASASTLVYHQLLNPEKLFILEVSDNPMATSLPDTVSWSIQLKSLISKTGLFT